MQLIVVSGSLQRACEGFRAPLRLRRPPAQQQYGGNAWPQQLRNQKNLPWPAERGQMASIGIRRRPTSACCNATPCVPVLRHEPWLYRRTTEEAFTALAMIQALVGLASAPCRSCRIGVSDDVRPDVECAVVQRLASTGVLEPPDLPYRVWAELATAKCNWAGRWLHEGSCRYRAIGWQAFIKMKKEWDGI